jgi:hypothetical protein
MLLGNRARPVRKADDLSAICEPIVYTMWDPRHLRTLQASAACYGDSFTLHVETVPHWSIPGNVRLTAATLQLTEDQSRRHDSVC